MHTHLCQSFKSQVMSLDGLYSVSFGVPSIPVHHKGDMFRHWALSQGPDEHRAELVDSPFCRRRG
jgi:hypothetical protein